MPDRMMSERWLPVPGRGGYEVSDRGRVRSVARTIVTSTGRHQRVPGRMLRTRAARDGYRYVRTGEGPRHAVHRLVLAAFVGPCPPGHQGCHNDGDPSNNDLSNLRWDTPSRNCRDQVRHGTHRQTQRTRCPRNHPLVAGNLDPSHLADGERVCLACVRACRALRYARDRGYVEPDRDVVADRRYALIRERMTPSQRAVADQAVSGGEVVAEQTATGEYASVSCSTP